MVESSFVGKGTVGVLETLLFVTVLSLDAFTASLAYGTGRIKIGFLPALVISLVGGGALWLSVSLGSFLSLYLSEAFCKTVGFIVLFVVGLFNFIQGALKSTIRRTRDNSANMHFRLRELDFFIEVYADETKADADHSSNLSIREALYLAVALSVDSLATGVGAGFTGMVAWELALAALAMNLAAVFLGCFLGKMLSRCAKLDLSWLGGAVLIALAVFRFVA